MNGGTLLARLCTCACSLALWAVTCRSFSWHGAFTSRSLGWMSGNVMVMTRLDAWRDRRELEESRSVPTDIWHFLISVYSLIKPAHVQKMLGKALTLTKFKIRKQELFMPHKLSVKLDLLSGSGSVISYVGYQHFFEHSDNHFRFLLWQMPFLTAVQMASLCAGQRVVFLWQPWPGVSPICHKRKSTLKHACFFHFD